MGKHIVEIRSYEDIILTKEVFLCSGGGCNKTLNVCVNIGTKKVKFEVLNGSKVVALEDELEDAIKVYNSI